jgi:predicted Ser/Thr protein kinase
VKGERLRDATTGAMADPEARLLREVESVLVPEGEDVKDFRRSVIGTIGARSLEDPRAALDYSRTFGDYLKRLRDDFFAKRKPELRRIIEDFLKFTADGERSSLDAKQSERSAHMLERLQSCGYCGHCARDAATYLLRKRYS